MTAVPNFKAVDVALSRIDAAMAREASPRSDRAQAMAKARQLLSPKRERGDTQPYPATALGPLAEACGAIAEHAQVQPAMAGQCLLGAASLLTQGLFNVETLAGPRPLSLYALTLGDSGDGKSMAQGAALTAVHEWQREEGERYRAELEDFDRAKATRKKGDDLPQPPAIPWRLSRDATVEGLRRDLDSGPCSQGIFSDEAAAILSGHGMTAEHRAKTAGVFNGLWDTGHLSVSRATAGKVERYGRRVALHWLIQPMACAEAVGDSLLVDLGFWPRFLAAWPAPLPPRLARPFRPDTLPAMVRYRQRSAELLHEPLPNDADKAPALPLDSDAHSLLCKAFERFEREARRGDLRVVKPFALRATEQACRIAGVLSAFAGRGKVDADTARGALALATYSVDTWRALIDEGTADQSADRALRLYRWLLDRPGWRERRAVIVKDGPAVTRTKDRRDAALDLLVEFKLVEVGGGEVRVVEAYP